MFLILFFSASASYASESLEGGSSDDLYSASFVQDDPYESFNRVVFNFNDTLDRVILKPIAQIYNAIVPKPVVTGIRHFFANLDTIPTIPNDLLQGNVYQAVHDTWRLGVNSTVGLLGFFDPASHIGLEPNIEDFGLTLARWGYKHSNYLEVPFLGPSTVRDLIGFPVDYYLFSIYPHVHPARTRYALYGLGVVSRRASLLSYQNVIQQAAIDRYIFVRDAWEQRRRWQIERNNELQDPYFEGEA